ncbi:TonB-dependent receptor [Dysgonomonas sp. 521]|uniref:SusC/RagA family TonB-linked outer membrane protein n=1 Tax=Dysgonomonas sp. 521 TaxID=2302932 RepID=UPI0013D48B84|nr:TonB-dependent receptor [Dysgonomonas sp. 521]NDV95276.1 TonB-dependent receptor [Dysgonomonas sp. 521]
MRLLVRNLTHRHVLLIAMILLSIGNINAQSNAFLLKGRVVDSNDSTLPGVNISIQGTTKGVATDADGNFELAVSMGQTIVCTYIGFETQTLQIKSRNFLEIKMHENELQLQDVVVLGYGTVLKKDMTGSAQTLSSKDISKAMAVNVSEALNGRVSGVLVTKASNRPGADMSIQIRGQNSFNYSNEPLYVIDGVPSQSGLRTLNPEDIESIDVLKDASSCAIYGSRGSNGVVIVTTKGATRTEGFNIEYKGSVGLKTPTHMPDMLGSEGNGMEYVNFRIQQWTNKFGQSSLSTPAFLTDDERRHIKHSEYYDWLREFAKDALITNHTITATGGSKNTSYTFGLGYMLDEGIAGSEKFSRITSNIGIEQRLGDKLRMGMNAYISFNTINHGSSDALLNAYLITPIVGRFNLDGSPTFSHRPGGRVNPFLQDENTKNESDGWAVNTLAFLEYKPIKDLALKTQIAMQYDGATNGTWTGTDTQAGQGVKLPTASRSEGTNQNWVWDNTITYDKIFGGKHRLNAIGLFSLQQDTHKSSGMTGEGMPYNSDWHAIHTAEQIVNVNSNYWESAMVSFMGRVNYVLMDKYMFTATARYDGTSRLAKENRWGLLPSAAIGWQMKNEDFLKDVDWISGLKLRASWGKTGNNSVGHDVTLTRLNMSTYSFGASGVKGFGVGGSLGNKNLKWEMTSEWNYGVDFGFLNGRINGAVDVYFRKTKDLIFQKQVANVNGYSSILENIGSTSNKGVEFTINSQNIVTKDFSWTTNLTFSLNKNKIVDLDGTKTDDLANRRFIGHPINVYYDVEQAGIWQEHEKEEAEKYNSAPGWIKIVDQDQNGVIDANDYKILGAPTPDWTAGMTNTFTYKNWDMSVYMYSRVGGLYNDAFTFYFLGLNNQDWNKLDVSYWTAENGNNKYPGIGLESLWTQVLSQTKGTFLKIQNITLGYTFSDKLLRKSGIKGLRTYVSVQNPFTFSSYLGSDPEIIGENLNTQLSLYPMTFTFGLNVKF